ncbi:glycosyl hydrolase 53 family protein [Microbacterium sp. NPDC089190]|uniref:glycosyl hydrolase 53 family protein n=1 Tax=Microbacterium sp. NPDC089190 TaxID=3155063 RepID=UPI00344DE5F9
MPNHPRPTALAALTLGVALAVAPLTAAQAAPAAEPVEAGITVPRVEGLASDFALGVDVSSVLSLEESGVVFRDDDGAPADLFEVLADHGVTDVRLRVWNDPFDAEGRGYGGGNVGVERGVEIGARATAAGLGVAVDFHYSDFWADPAKQKAPKAWAGMDTAETADAVGDFTREALTEFVAAGVDVQLVQVGNETNGGVAGVTGWPDMARVFSAGSAAVRAVTPDALVAVHVTNPERPGHYAAYAAQLAANDVDYDVFASLYYPFWHGTTENLTAVLRQVADTYDKKVMVAETSWVRTLDDADGHPDVIDAASEAEAYPISVQGQGTALSDVVQAVADVGDAGIGAYYWEPAWLPVGSPDQLAQNRVLWERDGSGWATSFAGEYDPEDAGEYFGGSAWDNQSLFDVDGTPLESLRTFAYVRTGAVAPREVTGVDTVRLSVTVGDAAALPGRVTVRYSDGTSEESPVTWEAAPDLSRPGVFEIAGATAEGHAALAVVTVSAENLLRNPGFEDPDVSMWIVDGPLSLRATDDPRTGERSAHFFAAEAMSFTLEQRVDDVPAGRYVAAGALQGGAFGDGTASIELASDADTSAAPFTAGGWRVWSEPRTDEIEIAEGESLTVRVSAELPAGAWGTIDDLGLERVGDAAPAPGGPTLGEPGPTPTPGAPSSAPTEPAPAEPAPAPAAPVPSNPAPAPATPAPPSAPAPGLAETGTSVPLGILAAGLLALATGTVLIAHRRRSRSPRA